MPLNEHYKNLNIPEKLVISGIKLAKTLGIPNIVAFANNHSRPVTEKLGFKQKSVGSVNKFYYPDKRYETRLMEKCVKEKVSISNESHR